jgi:RND family efflux transporter MFP subunit
MASLSTLAVLAALAVGCGGKPAGGPGGPGGPPGAQAVPVQAATVEDVDLKDSSEYLASLKSRRSVNVQPQVEGVVTRIDVKSGDRVAAGAPLLQIDPRKQRATVASQEAARKMKQAALDYAREQKRRMEVLYKGGAVSKQALDEAASALGQAQADYDALGAQVEEQRVELQYYRVTAPEAGIVGDIPVRVGDRVTTSTLLTTLDANQALEVYISVPLERAKDLRLGLPVEIFAGDAGQSAGGGRPIATSAVDFIAPQVDDPTQSVLVKAPVPSDRGLRAQQFVRARLVWSARRGPVVPVLAVTRISGQYFVFVVEPAPQGGGSVARQRPVQLGEVVGNDYVVLSGLKAGERVVVSGVQKLGDGAPVAPSAPTS